MNIIVSGPSGVGKTSILAEILKENNITFSVSYTTRPSRMNEINGRDYFFVSKTKFECMIERGEFIEWANVHGELYGTLNSSLIDEKGRDVILDIDVQGARNLRDRINGAIFVYIAPDSLDQLKNRIRGRGTETRNGILKRLQNVEDEMKQRDFYDYVIINNRLNDSIESLRNIIILERSKLRREKLGEI